MSFLKHTFFFLFFIFQEVTAVEFHPSALVLASGSKDCTVKLFDISKPSVKKAYRAIQVEKLLYISTTLCNNCLGVCGRRCDLQGVSFSWE